MRFAIPAMTLMLALIAGAATAAEPAWAKSLDQAYQSAKQQDRSMVIFIASSRCYYCDQMKEKTLTDPTVQNTLNGFIPIIVQASEYPKLLQKLGVRRYPTTLVVSPDAKIQDVIDGYVKPREFNSRLEATQRETVAVVPSE